MNLRDMSQNQLISWIESIPTDASFRSSVKQRIIDGINKYSKENGEQITGGHFWDCDDYEDVQEMTKVDRKSAKIFYRKIMQKKEESHRAAIPVAEEKQGGGNDVSFALCISAATGKYYKIRNVTKLTTISTVKSRYIDEMGGVDSSKCYIWQSPLEQIQLKQCGRNLKNDLKLEDIGITHGAHLPLVASQRVMGGGDWTIMYERCPVCLYKNKNNNNNNNLAKGYWHHPGGDKAEFKSSQPSDSYVVEIHHTANKVRCKSCKKECDGKSWCYKCPNHDYQKIPL